MRKNSFCFVILILLISGRAFGQAYSDDPRLKTIPKSISIAMQSHTNLKIYNAIAPLFLVADFDGDGKPDYAIRVYDIKGNKGLLIILSSVEKEIILGCGNIRGIRSDFSFDEWGIFRPWQPIMLNEKLVAPAPKGDYICLRWNGSGGGMLCWAQGKFVWYQQGE